HTRLRRRRDVLRGRLARLDRPARLYTGIGDGARRTQIIAKPEGAALPQHRYPQRKVRPAHAGTLDRLDADDARALLHQAPVEAWPLGLAPPGLALAKPAAAAATRQHAEDAKSTEPRKMPASSPRHAATMRWTLLTLLQRLGCALRRWSAAYRMVKEN